MASEKGKVERILVTGASGLLGRQIIYELLKKDIKPICMVRDSSDTSFAREHGLEIRTADLRDQEALDAVFSGVDRVIHTAALVNFRGDRLTQFTALNSFGALGCYRAAVKAGALRFVHVSSIVAVGAQKRGDKSSSTAMITEESEFNLGGLRIPYILSKRQAEELLLSESVKSAELIIVNLSLVVAPSRHGSDKRRIERILSRRWIPRLTNRFNLVDLRDVSTAIVNALRQGHHNRRYLLTGENTNMDNVLELFFRLSGRRPVSIQLPRAILSSAAAASELLRKLRGGGKLKFYRDLVKMLDYDWAYDNSRAKNELGFSPRPLEVTLEDLFREDFRDTFIRPI